jgi:hypothetical protein
MVRPTGTSNPDEPRVYETPALTTELRAHKVVALEGIEPSRSRINGF